MTKMKKIPLICGLLMTMVFILSCNPNGSSMGKTNVTSDSTATDRSFEIGDTNHHKILAMPIVIPEQDFINYAIQKNIKEIVWLKVGLINGDAAIKSHAKMMLKEHAKFNEQIKFWIAKHSNFALPAIDTIQEIYSKNKKGADFNVAWIEKLINDHKELLSNFKNAQTVVKDSALNKIISNTIPIVEAHLAMAKIMQQAQTK